MQIATFYPEHPILKKYIEFYYFLKTDSSDFSSVYYAFPHINNAFNIHKNVSCEIKEHFTTVYEDKRNRYLTIFNGKRKEPLLINLNGKLDKVTIVFKPLGFNQFIRKSFQEIVPYESQVFTEWDNDTSYNAFLEAFYTTGDNVKRVQLIETFFLSKYEPLKEESLLQKALLQLTDFEKGNSIEDIALSLSMNVRTFNRLFSKHLGFSPIEFKKVARFRHSLNNKLIDEKFKSLTEIGYESNFYDQSYFIKIYKMLTGAKPTSFFNSIERLADQKLIFKFKK